MATPSQQPREALEVDDPRVLRALAHPARQRIITELLAGRVMTATEASELVGLTPSAVSHHLRALERYGIAERVEGSGDARTRPWRSRITELWFTPSGRGGAQAANAVVQRELGKLARNIDAALAGAGADKERKDTIGLSVTETWLTDEERQELFDRVDALLADVPKRHSGSAPEGATRVSLVVSLVPVVDD
jgi:DNA-binding transcriptional ArsR family regulator